MENSDFFENQYVETIEEREAQEAGFCSEGLFLSMVDVSLQFVRTAPFAQLLRFHFFVWSTHAFLCGGFFLSPLIVPDWRRFFGQSVGEESSQQSPSQRGKAQSLQ